MTWAVNLSNYPGYPPIEPFVPATAPTGVAPWPPIAPGTLVVAQSPDWGTGEFIFGKANGTIRNFGLCVATPVWNSTNRNYDWNFTEHPGTANLGRPVYVCMSEQAVAATALTTGQFGWFMDTGLVPVNGSATVAAGTTAGLGAAGQIAANTAGKQLLNAVVVSPATLTQVKVATGAGNVNLSGGFLIGVNNVDGLFVGGYLSGTGVGASTIITAIDRINNILTVSVANSAAVTGNITQTNNNATIFYNVLQMDRAFSQGAIT